MRKIILLLTLLVNISNLKSFAMSAGSAILIVQNRTKNIVEMINLPGIIGLGCVLNFVENYLLFCNIFYLKLKTTMIILKMIPTTGLKNNLTQ